VLLHPCDEQPVNVSRSTFATCGKIRRCSTRTDA
jgi:hypothetical protein